MDHAFYLIFSLRNALYAVEASMVQEILWLPELTPIAEVPDYLVGVFNLRGKIVPVMDLNIRLGRMSLRYQLTDSVIILGRPEQEGFLLGIIVNEVRDIRSISTKEIEAIPSYRWVGVSRREHFNERKGEKRSNLVPDVLGALNLPVLAGVLKVEGDIILLLHVENLLPYAPDISDFTEIKESSNILDPSAEGKFCPEATSEEREVFQERARSLRQPIENQDLTGWTPLAVIRLSDEYFGVDLEVVREFVDIQKITPIPCCPEHIIGDMNLRGDILTVVDIRKVLHLPASDMLVVENAGSTIRNPRVPSTKSFGKVMVVYMDNLPQTPQFLVGILIDEVVEMVYLRPEEITAVPTAVKSLNEEYLKGMVLYGEKMLSILNLSKILTNENVIVDEEV